MSVTTIETTITYRSLMNKSKDNLATMVLQYADLNGDLHTRIAALEEANNALREALKPLASVPEMYLRYTTSETENDRFLWKPQSGDVPGISVGDCNRAREALALQPSSLEKDLTK